MYRLTVERGLGSLHEWTEEVGIFSTAEKAREYAKKNLTWGPKKLPIEEGPYGFSVKPVKVIA